LPVPFAVVVAFRRGRIRGRSIASAENPAQPLPFSPLPLRRVPTRAPTPKEWVKWVRPGVRVAVAFWRGRIRGRSVASAENPAQSLPFSPLPLRRVPTRAPTPKEWVKWVRPGVRVAVAFWRGRLNVGRAASGVKPARALPRRVAQAFQPVGRCRSPLPLGEGPGVRVPLPRSSAIPNIFPWVGLPARLLCRCRSFSEGPHTRQKRSFRRESGPAVAVPLSHGERGRGALALT